MKLYFLLLFLSVMLNIGAFLWYASPRTFINNLCTFIKQQSPRLAGLTLSEGEATLSHKIRANYSKTRYNIAIVTFALMYPDEMRHVKNILPALTQRNCYCVKWGYNCFTEVMNLDTDLDGDRMHYNKQIVVRKYLPYYDYVVFSDSDQYFLMENRVEDHVEDDIAVYLALCTHPQSIFDAGLFIMKNTKFSYDFLDEWYEKSNPTKHPRYINSDNGILHVLALQRKDGYDGSCDHLLDPSSDIDAIVPCFLKFTNGSRKGQFKWNYIKLSDDLVDFSHGKNIEYTKSVTNKVNVLAYHGKNIYEFFKRSDELYNCSVYFDLDNRRKKVFVHIPKTGGTSIEEFLNSYNISVGARYKNWHNAPLYALNNTFITKIDENGLHYSCSPWHIPPINYIPNSVAVVRDPVKRMISEFVYSINFFSYKEEGMGFTTSCESFNEWVPFVLNRYIQFPSQNDCHFIPQWHFAKHASKIYSFEDGGENFFSKVVSYFNLNTTHVVKKNSPKYSNNYFDCISPENIKRIKEFYYEDMENLSEYF